MCLAWSYVLIAGNDVCGITVSSYPQRASCKICLAAPGIEPSAVVRHIFQLLRCGYKLEITPQT